MKSTKFILTISITLLVVLFVNGAYYISVRGKKGSATLPTPIRTDDIGEAAEQLGRQPAEQLADYDKSSLSREFPVNLMVLGLDMDETRCDVIMLFHFVPSSSSLSILSVARDTRVLSDGVFTRINTLYSKGGEKRVAEKLTEITGLPVHYYITADFKGFREIIDALGGVEFYVPFRMNYDDPVQNLHIHLKKGLQVLNGKKAEQLVRYRKGNFKGQGYTEGDLGRISMQQEFMRALIKQKMNIRYLSRFPKIFSILKQYVKTNITIEDVTQYIASTSKIKAEEIEAFTLPGTSRIIGGKWYFIMDRQKTASMMNEHF